MNEHRCMIKKPLEDSLEDEGVNLLFKLTEFLKICYCIQFVVTVFRSWFHSDNYCFFFFLFLFFIFQWQILFIKTNAITILPSENISFYVNKFFWRGIYQQYLTPRIYVLHKITIVLKFMSYINQKLRPSYQTALNLCLT